MKKITYYQFMKWDGGDRHYPSNPCFLHKEDADKFIGDNRYDLFRENTVVVYESIEEYAAVNLDETKLKALAKLTDIEKAALGWL